MAEIITCHKQCMHKERIEKEFLHVPKMLMIINKIKLIVKRSDREKLLCKNVFSIRYKVQTLQQSLLSNCFVRCSPQSTYFSE